MGYVQDWFKLKTYKHVNKTAGVMCESGHWPREFVNFKWEKNLMSGVQKCKFKNVKENPRWPSESLKILIPFL